MVHAAGTVATRLWKRAFVMPNLSARVATTVQVASRSARSLALINADVKTKSRTMWPPAVWGPTSILPGSKIVKLGGTIKATPSPTPSPSSPAPTLQGIVTWGTNVQGLLGVGSLNPTYAGGPVPIQANGADVSLGGTFSCVMDSSGSVECWGSNSNGQLGVETVDDYVSTPVYAATYTGATGIACGGSHACLMNDDLAGCWGAGGSGQLGNGDTSDSYNIVASLGFKGYPQAKSNASLAYIPTP
ncbi:hypothetical protein H632_c242p0 [Helicosporidium sp. ATCC 50920]|nr:hypothetical protein H632_c242p0 [Helicosporidium sp. ATCC 50920]|eukprot:KDD76394.1 hypothetical protein H632_c242p0 [Helicosporidium sp. ATCC 50920]